MAIPLPPLNKNMQALPTPDNGYLACSTGLAAKPVGYVRVFVDGRGVATAENKWEGRAYWSRDAGVTPLAYADLDGGDVLYWMPYNIGIEWKLDGTEPVEFDYEIAPPEPTL